MRTIVLTLLIALLAGCQTNGASLTPEERADRNQRMRNIGAALGNWANQMERQQMQQRQDQMWVNQRNQEHRLNRLEGR